MTQRPPSGREPGSGGDSSGQDGKQLLADLDRRILYRDANLLILDKPAGLAVHPGPSGMTSLEEYLPQLCFELARPPALAHRLDRDTSGCLVLGRHHKALRKLGQLFAGGRVEKVYWAVVEGRPPAAEGRIDLPLRKATERKGWWMEPHPEGQSSITDYRIVRETAGLCWLELRPRTGRTHQIRVHCAAVGCPVLGDPIYSRVPAPLGSLRPDIPLHLHARAIGIPYQASKPPIAAVAPPPKLLAATLDRFGPAGP